MEYVANCKYVAYINTSLVSRPPPPPKKSGKGPVKFANFLVCAESAYYAHALHDHVIASTVGEFLSHAPFSNLVSARCALLTNYACVSGWSCTHEPTMHNRSSN